MLQSGGLPQIEAAQALPHAPQFATSVAGNASHPVAATPSQSTNPAVHDVITQCPLVHVVVELGAAQAAEATGPSTTPSQSLSTPSHTSGGPYVVQGLVTW